jgi:hypothetical protein
MSVLVAFLVALAWASVGLGIATAALKADDERDPRTWKIFGLFMAVAWPVYLGLWFGRWCRR